MYLPYLMKGNDYMSINLRKPVTEKEFTLLKNYVLTEISKRTDRPDGGIEIYTDYRDRNLSDRFLKEMFESDSPEEYFYDALEEWACDYECDNDIVDEIRNSLPEYMEEYWNERENEITDFIHENTYYYYSAEDFNNEINVNIMVDCGNANYDYACDNILNYCGNGNIDTASSMLWLAKTQGKETELREAVEWYYREDKDYSDREKDTDSFIESCIQELENLTCPLGTMTFLVKMPLFEVINLIENQNKKRNGYILIGKDTECGLFDSINGGGSVLEISLDKDIKLPISYANVCVEGCNAHGYDVNEVYGLIDNCWKSTIKEIKLV